MAVAAWACWSVVTLMWATIGWHWWEVFFIAAGAVFLGGADAPPVRVVAAPPRYRDDHRRGT